MQHVSLPAPTGRCSHRGAGSRRGVGQPPRKPPFATDSNGSIADDVRHRSLDPSFSPKNAAVAGGAFGCCRGTSEEWGPGWPAALPGPLCGGESGTTGREAGVDMARAWMSELRQRRSGCPMPGERQAGAFSLGYFSFTPGIGPALLFVRAPARAWTSKRDVPRAPQAHESSCSRQAPGRAHAYSAIRNTNFPR